MGVGKDGARDQAKGFAKEVKGKANEVIGAATKSSSPVSSRTNAGRILPPAAW